MTEIRLPDIRHFLPRSCKCERVAFFFVLLAALAAGCGGAQPDDTVRDYFSAIVAGDGERACDTLTSELRRDIDRSRAARRTGASCVEVMELAAALNPGLSQGEVEDLSVELEEDGDRASARLRNPLVKRQETIQLIQGDEGWKISTLETRPR
jgi:hypothetical protein